jgi:quercetin dioxygenase-like cupin family protein
MPSAHVEESDMKSIVPVFACACLVSPVQAQQQSPPASPPQFVLREVTGNLPKADQLEVRVRNSTIQPGSIGEWHTHAMPPVVYVLEGTLSVEVRDKETIHHKAGEATIEPINTVIRATNQGQTPVKLVIFQVSPPDVPFSHPAPKH